MRTYLFLSFYTDDDPKIELILRVTKILENLTVAPPVRMSHSAQAVIHGYRAAGCGKKQTSLYSVYMSSML